MTNNLKDMDFIPVRRRANSFHNNVEDILTESRRRLVEDKDNTLLESEMNRDVAFTRARARDEINKSIYKNVSVMNESKVDMFVSSEAFANIVYKAIPLDEDYKAEHKNEIFEKASGVYKALEENGTIKEGNHVWNGYFQNFTETKTALMENANDLIAVERVLTETENSTQGQADLMAGIVTNKILETISNEKMIAMNRKAIMQSNRKFNGNTLFSAMNVRNYKMFSSDDKFVEVPKDKLYDITFAETIIDYAILECLNTFDLVSFKTESVINSVKHI